MSVRQTTAGPPAGHTAGKPRSVDLPFRVGPKKPGQSPSVMVCPMEEGRAAGLSAKTAAGTPTLCASNKKNVARRMTIYDLGFATSIRRKAPGRYRRTRAARYSICNAVDGG